MATKIIAAQKKEMAEFNSWLKKHEASMALLSPVNNRLKLLSLLSGMMGEQHTEKFKL